MEFFSKLFFSLASLVGAGTGVGIPLVFSSNNSSRTRRSSEYQQENLGGEQNSNAEIKRGVDQERDSLWEIGFRSQEAKNVCWLSSRVR